MPGVEVEEAHERCVQLGANVQFAPKEDRDIPGYWSMFVFDPDGMRIEILSFPPEGLPERAA